MSMEISFLELRCKQVVNVVDGRQLGHICDMLIDLSTCSIRGILVPGERSFWNVIKPAEPFFIPFCQILKIGEDAILVELPGPIPTGVFSLGQNNKDEKK